MTEEETLARTLWGECRGEPTEGKVAVAFVIRNRAAQPGWWGHDIESVCRARQQFSCWNENDPNRAKLLAVTEEDQAYRLCLSIARAVIKGDVIADPTGGADHYHAIGITPAWAEGQIPTATIGRHKFFKLGLSG